MMAANFGQKIVINMKSTNMPVSILPKTKRFKVLCVFVANYGVNNEKSEIHLLPGVLKMLTMETRNCSKLRKIHSGQGHTSVPDDFFIRIQIS